MRRKSGASNPKRMARVGCYQPNLSWLLTRVGRTIHIAKRPVPGCGWRGGSAAYLHYVRRDCPFAPFKKSQSRISSHCNVCASITCMILVPTTHCTILVNSIAPRYPKCRGYHTAFSTMLIPKTITTTIRFKRISTPYLALYHHLLEFLPDVAHCRQCLVVETTAHVLQTFLPQSLQAKGDLSRGPLMSMSTSMSISMPSSPLCNGVSQSSQRGSCDRVWSCCAGIEKMGCTGGAGSCFQKECSVDF